MKFARWVFIVAGIYGIIIITPMFFTAQQEVTDLLGNFTHHEYYYGFGAVTLAWQILFLFIAINPVKYKLIIIPAILEKIPFGAAMIFLFDQGRASSLMLSGGIIDVLLGLLFIVAFFKAKEKKIEEIEDVSAKAEPKQTEDSIKN